MEGKSNNTVKSPKAEKKKKNQRKDKGLSEDNMPSCPAWMDAILPQREVKKSPLQQQA